MCFFFGISGKSWLSRDWKEQSQNFDTAARRPRRRFRALVGAPSWQSIALRHGVSWNNWRSNLHHKRENLGIRWSPTKGSKMVFTLDDHRIDIILPVQIWPVKKALLRTIGTLNTDATALCGAPVCFDEMKVSVMTILSYMRIKERLASGASHDKP